MTVYVVKEYLNDYLENGGGFTGIADVFDSREKAEAFCEGYRFEDVGFGDFYYEWEDCEVRS